MHLSNELLMLFVNHGLDVLVDMLLMDDWLVSLMENVLVMLMEHVFLVLDQDILMTLVNYVLMDFLNNRSCVVLLEHFAFLVLNDF
jgi:hypothetical protein